MIDHTKLGIITAIFILLVSSGFTLPARVVETIQNDFGITYQNLIDQLSKDNKPPTVVLSMSAPTGNNGWYNKPVSVTARAYDGGSGVTSVNVSLNGSAWYKGLMIRDDGTYKVMAKAADRAGNVGGTYAIIKVDMTPPDVSFQVPEPDGENGYYVNDFSILLSGTDNLSGVVDSQLSIAGNSNSAAIDHLDAQEAFNEETVRAHQIVFEGNHISVKSVKAKIAESGSFSIEGYVEDEAGNQTLVSTSLKVDLDNPQITIDSPNEFKDDIQLFGNVHDFQSGIDSVLIDYGEGWRVAEVGDDYWSTTWSAGDLVEGKYPINAKVIDIAGNVSFAEYNATVINTLWPFFTFSVLVIAAALFFALDPRRPEWSRWVVQIKRHQQMYENGLFLGLEEEYKND